MHPEDLKSALRKAGVMPRRIAERLGVDETAVSHVIHGRCTSHRIACEIGVILGMKPAQIWPGRYTRKSKSAR